jgi:hypothetical protein
MLFPALRKYRKRSVSFLLELCRQPMPRTTVVLHHKAETVPLQAEDCTSAYLAVARISRVEEEEEEQRRECEEAGASCIVSCCSVM